MNRSHFEQIYTGYFQRLTYIAYSIIKDWYIAEDVVQEAFIKAYRKIDTIDHWNKLGSWLSAITTRTAIDFLRAEKRRQWVPADLTFSDYSQFAGCSKVTIETEVEVRLLKEEIHKYLHHLPDVYQEVLLLKLEYGLKESEIAGLLQLKSATVRTRLHRARKQLKQVLAEKSIRHKF